MDTKEKRKQMVPVIQIRVSTISDGTWYRYFKTASTAHKYIEVLTSHSIFDHSTCITQVEPETVGRWDGKSL